MNYWVCNVMGFKYTKILQKQRRGFDQGIITDYQVGNWFSKFRFVNMSLRDKPRIGHLSNLNQDA